MEVATAIVRVMKLRRSKPPPKSQAVWDQYSSWATTQSEEELKNIVLKDNGASNHTFNNRDRFITYTLCVIHEPTYADSTFVEFKGMGTARVTVTTQRGKLDITLLNALYVSSYQFNILFTGYS
jgi:hypothetical protein